MPGPPETSPYRLLVEGKDDKAVVVALLKRHGYNWDNVGITRPFVQEVGSVSTLLDVLPIATRSTYERLGAVLDADEELADRWSSIRQRLHGEGLTLPEQPTAGGTIVTGRKPGSRVGVWLMPNNEQSGILEHFLQGLVPADDACWAEAKRASTHAAELGCAHASQMPKHELHTWLAWQDPPGRPFGLALTAQKFGCESPEALQFVAWFRNLFQ